MNDAALKTLIALILACTLFAGSAIIWLGRKSVSSFFQLLGERRLSSLLLLTYLNCFVCSLEWVGDPKVALAIISICCAPSWAARYFLSATYFTRWIRVSAMRNPNKPDELVA